MYKHERDMLATVRKWGNSLAVRIPKPLAEDAALKEGTRVRMSVRDSRLIVEPKTKSRYELADLLRCVKKQHLHTETETGGPVGKEFW